MLTKRLIPCLDVDQGRVVKGISFVNLTDAGDPVRMAEVYNNEGADELVFLDITASAENRNTMVDVVKNVSKQVFIPLTVGGGIRNLNDIKTILRSGADKVSLNTAAVESPNIIKKSAEMFGNQCIVIAIDAKRIMSKINNKPNDELGIDSNSIWEVYTYGGRVSTGIDAVKWAKKVVKMGAGELLLTSMDMDGTKSGYDLDLNKEISTSVEVPVIASGGAGSLEDLHDGLTLGKADAVLAASIFHFGKYSIKEAKEYLSSKGVGVRI